jgi:glutamate transport system permease protein
VISVTELLERADRLNTATAQAIPVFLGAAIGYLILTIPSGLLFGVLERKVAIKR